MSSVISSSTDISAVQLSASVFASIFRTERRFDPNRVSKRNTYGRLHYLCLHCSWDNRYKGNCTLHAISKHRNLIQDAEDASQPSTVETQSSIAQWITKSASDSSLRHCFDRQRYIEALISLICHRRSPFSSVEWDEIEELVLAANPAIRDLLTISRRSIGRHINSTFNYYKYQLFDTFSNCRHRIHFATDLWTSPHRRGVLGITVQWVSNDFKLQRALIGLRECRYSHSGEAQANIITTVLQEYGIFNLGYYTGDNATSNDKCLQFLSQRLAHEHQVISFSILYSSTNCYRSNSTLKHIVFAASVISSISLFKLFFTHHQKKPSMPPLRLHLQLRALNWLSSSVLLFTKYKINAQQQQGERRATRP